MIRSNQTPSGEKAKAVAEVMDLEERHGSMPRAALAADLLIRGANVPEALKANAYALKARIAASAKRYSEVQAIEGQLSALGSSPETQEAVGEARYLVAASLGRSVQTRYFNLAVRDPQQLLTQRYEVYKQVRGAYLKVCEAGATSFCAPAMVKLNQVSMGFVKAIEDIQIQDTLAKDVVARFNATKQAIYNDAARTSERADGKAQTALAEGNTDPYWTEAVLWQNSADWNFDRVSGETGNGYVQWSVSDVSAKVGE